MQLRAVISIGDMGKESESLLATLRGAIGLTLVVEFRPKRTIELPHWYIRLEPRTSQVQVFLEVSDLSKRAVEVNGD
jgi:hypothetical protein